MPHGPGSSRQRRTTHRGTRLRVNRAISDFPDDVNLAEDSGFDVAEALHEIDDGAAAPVILISTQAEPDLTDMIETSPAIGFLAKSALSARAITAALARLGESG